MGHEDGNCTMDWGNLIDMFRVNYGGDNDYYEEPKDESTITINLNINIEQNNKEVPIFSIK